MFKASRCNGNVHQQSTKLKLSSLTDELFLLSLNPQKSTSMTFSSLLTSRTPCHCFWQELSFVSTEGSLNPTYCTPDISLNSKLHLDHCADFCISKIYSLLSLLF